MRNQFNDREFVCGMSFILWCIVITVLSWQRLPFLVEYSDLNQEDEVSGESRRKNRLWTCGVTFNIRCRSKSSRECNWALRLQDLKNWKHRWHPIQNSSLSITKSTETRSRTSSWISALKITLLWHNWCWWWKKSQNLSWHQRKWMNSCRAMKKNRAKM